MGKKTLYCVATWQKKNGSLHWSKPGWHVWTPGQDKKACEKFCDERAHWDEPLYIVKLTGSKRYFPNPKGDRRG